MYFLGFAPCFIILSISVEGLFFVIYSVVLLGWVVIEKIMKYPELERRKKVKVVEDGTRNELGGGYVFRFGDVRLALAFLFFVHLGFFGIGKWVFFSTFYVPGADQLFLVRQCGINIVSVPLLFILQTY